ncbi:MAG: tRNA (adenosine(37)-N6)-threonylcarbamoyltransferase complex dimerization subunit type 1 TsaB [Acidobacteriota bacterium]|nr:MAG: tRNA (adenosine(37)-N6)-threonylcarbamoyltransferase complex dimerization subunit type 1 TsaB [Acidobacteriota bacterium]
MHTTLSIDTCIGGGSAALFADGAEIRAEDELGRGKDDAPQIHAVNEMLVSEGFRIDSPSEMIVTRGPGSFTGVRTGISILRGLLRARDLAFLTCTVMEAMTAAVPETFDRCRTAIYAGKREVAVQDFERQGNHFVRAGSHFLIEKGLLFENPGRLLVLGPGLESEVPEGTETGEEVCFINTGRNIARLAYRHVRSLPEGDLSKSLEPLYTRDFIVGRS